MPVQYFYPVEDITVNGWVGKPNQTPSLYTNIDEGVVTPNDADYIAGSGVADGNLRQYRTVFDFTNLNISPSLITLSIRYSGGVYQDTGGGTFNSTSTARLVDTGGPTMSTFYLPVSSSSFTNSVTNVTEFVSGIIDSLRSTVYLDIFDDIFYVASGGFSPLQHFDPNKLLISSAELMFSGVYNSNNGCPLYICGSAPTGNSLPLYTVAADTLASGLDLYLEAADFNGAMDLFLKVIPPSGLTNTCNLYLKTFLPQTGSGNTSCNLFVKNHLQASGSMPLYLSVGNIGYPYSSMNLYIKSQEPTEVNSFINGPGVTTLVVRNNAGSGNSSTNLFISNFTTASGNQLIYIKGQGTIPLSGNTTLFICQKSDVTNFSGNTNLYTFAGDSFVNTQMDIFISGKTNEDVNNSFNMFINSAVLGGSGLFNRANLYISADNLNTYVPLYLKNGSTSDSDTASMNLFIGSASSSTNSTPLYISNIGRPLESGINLYTSGAGVNEGFYTSQASMNLFIGHSTEGMYNNMNMYVKAPDGQTSGTTLYINGGTYITNSTNLVVPSPVGLVNRGNNLYINGF